MLKTLFARIRITQTYIVIYKLIPVSGYEFSIYDIDVSADIYSWLIMYMWIINIETWG